jgi:hypothetical protein
MARQMDWLIHGSSKEVFDGSFLLDGACQRFGEAVDGLNPYYRESCHLQTERHSRDDSLIFTWLCTLNRIKSQLNYR